MRNSERQWLLQIQMKQMQSDNPYIDDFYYNQYMQQLAMAGLGMCWKGEEKSGIKKEKELAQRCLEFSSSALGLSFVSRPAAAPTQVILPSDSVLRINHRLGEYVPRVDTANALGNVTVFSVRAPRTLISVARGEETEADSAAENDAASRAERVKQSRKKALLHIEAAFSCVMQVKCGVLL